MQLVANWVFPEGRWEVSFFPIGQDRPCVSTDMNDFCIAISYLYNLQSDKITPLELESDSRNQHFKTVQFDMETT